MNTELRSKLRVALDIIIGVKNDEVLAKDNLPDTIEDSESGADMAQNAADLETASLMINRAIER